ncbi:hypothetical protein L198_01796 [Cryptococcus wingfieldii CBS 7118]|uniref:Uncharacterized protein n=1 Tax=Cryptococcus wingfieldii CBS 7118 TaxID=1295528 RepID=A0A1E3JW74_9TREE|nr:hypothetical protein L198_01796 [Cryptococcus wingfieldii CBS 7118]ODO05109.1 hypothetical protein L198_01796 [Cryptococcus wingfieldii CBS 7118]
MLDVRRPLLPILLRESDHPLLGWAQFGPDRRYQLSFRRATPDDVANPDGSPKRGKNELDRWTEYGQAKWATIPMAKYFANTYGPKQMIAVSMHPASAATNLSAHIGFLGWAAPILFSPSQGALNQLWAGTLPIAQARELNGKYVVPFSHVLDSRGDLLGEEGQEKARKLSEWCDEQGKKFE